VAEVTAWFGEKVVVDCYCDATTQTAACYGILEGGKVVLFWVACEMRHFMNDSEVVIGIKGEWRRRRSFVLSLVQDL
jgi:hypothetical protein